MKTVIKIILALAVVAAVAGIAVFSMNGEENGDQGGGEEDSFITFYLFDNFQYDSTSGLLSQNNHLAEGIWVKGYGDTKEDAFKDACKTAGIEVEVSGGFISSFNGAADGNFCQMGWVKNHWDPSVYFNSQDTFQIRYMAIGHGRWSNGSYGNPPTPQQNPDDIRWYWGESLEPGTDTAVKFHFYDNYKNDPNPSQPSIHPSDTSKFVANGYNVVGYGTSMEKALKDACKRCYGDNVVVAYNSNTGIINRISTVSGNLNTLLWNGTAWEKCDLSTVTMTDGMIIAVCHGLLSAEDEIPEPDVKGSEIGWFL